MSSPFQSAFMAKSPLNETAAEKAEMDAAEANPSQDEVEINNANKPIVPGTGMKRPADNTKLGGILEATVYSDNQASLSNYPQKEINRANQEYKENINDPEAQNDPRVRKINFKK